MDREFFKAKIECGIHRAKLRGIKVVSDGWYLVERSGKFELDGSHRVYILGMIIEGKRYGLYNRIAAGTLGVSETIMQSFSNGYCLGGYYKGSVDDDEYFAFEFGKQCAHKLGIHIK